MSKTLSLHHIVFCTRNRAATIPATSKRDLFAYIHGIIKAKGCRLHRINGMEDHDHMLVDIDPTISMADLVKTIKQSSSYWIKQHPDFRIFDGWARGYYAFSLSRKEFNKCMNYIINQEKHHSGVAFTEGTKELANANGVDWHPQDWI
ncbi:MAG: IS200/IS605 family transposase [Bacteroidales bacterium]|nr:IS200/IS605 family transposase [Bacteroidales bacterium]